MMKPQFVDLHFTRYSEEVRNLGLCGELYGKCEQSFKFYFITKVGQECHVIVIFLRCCPEKSCSFKMTEMMTKCEPWERSIMTL